MEMVQYLTEMTHRNIDHDGVYGTQCVDLPLAVLSDLQILPKDFNGGNGIDFAENVEKFLGGKDNTNWLAPEFNKLYVVSFYGGKYGHVALLYNGLLYEYNYLGSPNIRNYTTDNICWITEVYNNNNNSKKWKVTTEDGLNIRALPTLNSTVLGALQHNEIVEMSNIYEFSYGFVWTLVNVKGLIGWCVTGRDTGRAESDDYLIEI